MDLSADFNESGYKTSKINAFVLGVSHPYSEGSSYTTHHTFDFLARVLTTRTGDSAGGASVTPFSLLDADSLETLRQRLIALGGKPPGLTPHDAAPGTAPRRSLNP